MSSTSTKTSRVLVCIVFFGFVDQSDDYDMYSLLGDDLSEIMTSFDRLTKERDNVQKLCSSLAKCRHVANAMRDVRREMEGKNDHFNAIKLLKIVSEKKFSLETESFTIQVDDWLVPTAFEIDTRDQLLINIRFLFLFTAQDVFQDDGVHKG